MYNHFYDTFTTMLITKSYQLEWESIHLAGSGRLWETHREQWRVSELLEGGTTGTNWCGRCIVEGRRNAWWLHNRGATAIIDDYVVSDSLFKFFQCIWELSGPILHCTHIQCRTDKQHYCKHVHGHNNTCITANVWVRKTFVVLWLLTKVVSTKSLGWGTPCCVRWHKKIGK